MNKYKAKIVCLTVLTFGLIWIKWRKQKKHTKNTIYQVDKIPFDIKQLKNFLGEKDNILEIETKPSRINIFVQDVKKIKAEQIKNLKGITGVFLKSNSISLILGEFSQAVAKELKND
ncbi:hypothetical protein [Mycoplasmopsis glycophila]|uniref:PTS system IIB component n=1 Tax=Mycoplasmopsis glycophila TaxID=171285 RepID=A0A449AV60_9BACT|nr:hypothetical protein [Mycoplasmopsis glycophila]VEU70368.1 PTS system IIB component [Mycoplasmopsis glycophila]